MKLVNIKINTNMLQEMWDWAEENLTVVEFKSKSPLPQSYQFKMYPEP